MINSIKKLGPGLLFAGAAIGVSHLVLSTKAGGDFGFGLVWALIIINLIKYPFFEFAPRYTLSTGKSLLEGYREIGKSILIVYFLLNVLTMFTIQAAVTSVSAGIATKIFGFESNLLVSIGIALLCFTIIIIGKFDFLDKTIKLFVFALCICTMITAFVSLNNATEFNLNQVFPMNNLELIFLVSFMGWMPGPLDISIWHSLWSLEKKKINPELTFDNFRFDFKVGYLLTLIMGLVFISLGATVLYNSGTNLSSNGSVFAAQLINLYTSSIGENWFYVIAFGAFFTMLSTTIATLDASPRTMSLTCKILNFQFGRNQNFWLIILTLGTCLIFLFFSTEMGFLIKIATILSFVTAPLYAILNFILVTKKNMPKKYRPKKIIRIWSFLSIIFLLAFSFAYILTLFL
ncbi:MAG: iron transporter [Flavobacteriales bacterium]|nr:iron transporter [Flavobacteriales bacterium]|tara:strand:- start:5281 stop:6492 length:1212 start_codon:yes stop_codon:yes gene_type:complete